MVAPVPVTPVILILLPTENPELPLVVTVTIPASVVVIPAMLLTVDSLSTGKMIPLEALV